MFKYGYKMAGKDAELGNEWQHSPPNFILGRALNAKVVVY
jgi:hypothetical protein